MKNRALVLLSGEGTSVPLAEAKSLFLTYDPSSRFDSPSPRLIIAESNADPFLIGRRIAFARRTGVLLGDMVEAAPILRGHSIRFRYFNLGSDRSVPDPARYLHGVDATIDLQTPDYEVTLVRADAEHLAITSPRTMVQGWSRRRPRRRPYFHPSAIFPKLSRALVNLSMCREGDFFLDPFAGTGSIPIEAFLIGAKVVAMDQAEEMAKGSVANMRHFQQEWLGTLRADSTRMPVRMVDAAATDVPYGRASSTHGRNSAKILDLILPALADVMKAGTTLVLMHQKENVVDTSSEFSLVEEHDLHVHKLLTRTISVLRRR